jgi:hypothetical protein
MAMRTPVRSRNCAALISRTRTARFGVTSSAPSATSRDTASRTGMIETPSRAAASRSDSFSPGAIRPEIRSSESCA